MTLSPILYSFRRCPYAMRARMALLVSETSCEIREVKLSAKPADMIAVSPKATVPVLVLPGGRVIDESLDIMHWALERHDPAQWLGGVDADLIAANDCTFKHHLDRYKYADRHAGDATDHRAAGLKHLQLLEERLTTLRYLYGASMGLTDAALLPFVRQFAEVDRTWFDALPLPHLQGWLADGLATPLFEAAMIQLNPWQSGDEPVLFGSQGVVIAGFR
jgi:glutathione S-transferase